MSGNSFGQIFKITTCGESHGGAVAVIVDGCPAGLQLHETDIQKELDRRKPGQSHITTTRLEHDKIQILSGVFNGYTIGTPILIIAYNKDAKSADYDNLKNVFRPSHADYTYFKKYGIRDHNGGGRSSARETLSRVAGGSIAKKWLSENLNIEILSYVEQVGAIRANIQHSDLTFSAIEQNIIRCPDVDAAHKMIELIKQLKETGDSIGGVIKCVIKNVPAGLGDPVFEKLNANLAKAMFSINAVRGFDVGAGFEQINVQGSVNNDQLYFDEELQIVKTRTNNAGGINGGISNGEDIYFRVMFKAVSTISITQTTLNVENEAVQINAKGRHDPCVLPRAVPIVDAMSALVIMDHYLKYNAYQHKNYDI